MGCLNTNIRLESNSINITTVLNPVINCIVKNKSKEVKINYNIEEQDLNIKINTTPTLSCKVTSDYSLLSEDKIRCSLICAIDKTIKYIIVNPEMIWLTQDDAMEDFTVISNTNWIIE